MSKYSPIALYACLALVVLYVLRDAHATPRVQAFERLEGQLYHAEIAEIVKADTPLPRPETYLPHVPVYVDNVAALKLPSNANSFIGDISTDASVHAKILFNAPEAKTAVGQKPASRRPHKATAAVNTVVPSTPTPSAVAAPQAPAAPRDTYLTLDAKLAQNPMSFPVNNRIARGGITIVLEQLGKFEGFYLLKFSVTNNEQDEFFISKAFLTVKGRPILSSDFWPFSCRTGEVINGIERFSIKDVAGQRVGFSLTESGGKERKFEIRSIDFAF